MNQYETDAADMLAVAYLENRGNEFDAACKVLAGVMQKRDEDVQLLIGELNKNKAAWEQAQEILSQMQQQGEQALADSERFSAESEAKLAAGLADIDARYEAKKEALIKDIMQDLGLDEKAAREWLATKELTGLADEPDFIAPGFEMSEHAAQHWFGKDMAAVIKDGADSPAPAAALSATSGGDAPDFPLTEFGDKAEQLLKHLDKACKEAQESGFRCAEVYTSRLQDTISLLRAACRALARATPLVSSRDPEAAGLAFKEGDDIVVGAVRANVDTHEGIYISSKAAKRLLRLIDDAYPKSPTHAS